MSPFPFLPSRNVSHRRFLRLQWCKGTTFFQCNNILRQISFHFPAFAHDKQPRLPFAKPKMSFVVPNCTGTVLPHLWVLECLLSAQLRQRGVACGNTYIPFVGNLYTSRGKLIYLSIETYIPFARYPEMPFLILLYHTIGE